MKHLLIVSIFTWLLLYCKSFILFIFLFIGILIYKYKFNKIKTIHIFIILIIYLNSTHNYSIYNNQVLETYENYIIASINHRKILIYTDEIYFKGEKIEVINDIKKIPNNSNFNIFDFKNYMKQRNIEYYLNNEDVIIYKNNSIKRYIYEKISTYQDPYLINIFYGYSEQSLLVSSGLHYSYINQILNNYFSIKITNILLLLFSFLFPFKFPILRILLSNLIKTYYKLDRKDQCGFLYLLCMFLIPSCIYSLSFIIPYIFNLVSIFVEDKKTKKTLNKLFLCFIQYYYFNELNILQILFFGLYRNINICLFMIGIIQLLIPFDFELNNFYLLIENIFSYKLLDMFGHVSFFILILFIICFIYSMHNKNKIIYCLLILVYIPIQGYLNPFYSIDFINVGQGDSILIKAPFNLSTTLIDIPKNKENIVIDYLKSIGIYKIDHLIITHDDSDHSGGKDNFINQFNVEKIINTNIDVKTKYYELLNMNIQTYDNENDNSLIYYLNINHMNYCFMADVSKQVEEDLINKYELKCDILKVGHHGSKTSTSDLFVQRIQPIFAIISVKKDNYYGHPHFEVLNILDRYNVYTMQTSLNGAISIKSFYNLHFYSTSSKEFGIIQLE